MNKMKKCLACIAAVLLLLASCKKDDTQFFITDGSFTGSGLTSSSADVVLTQAAENNNAVTFSWSEANFGEKPVIRYTLQLSVPSDTTSGWPHAKSFSVDNGKLTQDFIVKDLNNLLNSMGLTAGTANDIAVRIKADVPQNTGAASSIAAVYSNTLLVKITSYATALYIPGDYQGWNPGAAPLLNPVDGRAGLYEGYVYMPGTGIQYFKYTNAPDWNHTNYGDGGNGTFNTDGAAGGLNVPDGGYYELTANLNNNTWTATKTTWSIIGDATPGGWNNDTQMTYDAVNQVWKVTCEMKTAGSFKFRANNAWSIDFGLDHDSGKIAYADNPFFGYREGLWNLSVPSDGNYTITLDLHISQHYTYTLQKN